MKNIILKSTKKVPRDAFAAPVSTSSHAPSDLSIEVEDLDPGQMHKVRRDLTVLCVAPAMPMALIRPSGPPSEPESAPVAGGYPPVSWGIRAVRATASDYKGEGVTVAVLDTGIDADHPAFRGVRITRANFTEGAAVDEDGHGTHCAGVIFGRDTEGCRIGVAPEVPRALIGKVLGRGGGTTEAIFKAILWAYQNEAHVISMSLGTDFTGYQEELMGKYPPKLATSMALVGYRENVRFFDRLSQVTSPRTEFVRGSIVVAASGNESAAVTSTRTTGSRSLHPRLPNYSSRSQREGGRRTGWADPRRRPILEHGRAGLRTRGGDLVREARGWLVPHERYKHGGPARGRGRGSLGRDADEARSPLPSIPGRRGARTRGHEATRPRPG